MQSWLMSWEGIWQAGSRFVNEVPVQERPGGTRTPAALTAPLVLHLMPSDVSYPWCDILWPSSCFRSHHGQQWDQGEGETLGCIRGKSYTISSWKGVWGMNPKSISITGGDLYQLKGFWRWTLGFKIMHIPWEKQISKWLCAKQV